MDHHGRVVRDLRFQRLEALKDWWFGRFMWRIFRFQPLVCRGKMCLRNLRKDIGMPGMILHHAIGTDISIYM